MMIPIQYLTLKEEILYAVLGESTAAPVRRVRENILPLGRISDTAKVKRVETRDQRAIRDLEDEINEEIFTSAFAA
jgi:hypothetical protein